MNTNFFGIFILCVWCSFRFLHWRFNWEWADSKHAEVRLRSGECWVDGYPSICDSENAVMLSLHIAYQAIQNETEKTQGYSWNKAE